MLMKDLTKHVFNPDYTRSRYNWCSCVEDILKELSLGDAFGNKTPVNNYEMIRLADIYEVLIY